MWPELRSHGYSDWMRMWHSHDSVAGKQAGRQADRLCFYTYILLRCTLTHAYVHSVLIASTHLLHMLLRHPEPTMPRTTGNPEWLMSNPSITITSIHRRLIRGHSPGLGKLAFPLSRQSFKDHPANPSSPPPPMMCLWTGEAPFPISSGAFESLDPVQRGFVSQGPHRAGRLSARHHPGRPEPTCRGRV
jgi:hypothetical protein